MKTSKQHMIIVCQEIPGSYLPPFQRSGQRYHEQLPLQYSAAFRPGG